MAYVICEPCIGVKDRACVDVCPCDCIYEGPKEGFPDMMFVDPDECIDCGVCQPECPVDAIFPDVDVPDEWQHFTALNERYFQAAAVAHENPAPFGQMKTQRIPSSTVTG